MDERTLTALKGSIEKWERIVAGTGRDLGTLNCPLCAMFYSEDGPDRCAGCPVFEKTGKPMCGDTPYFEYDEGNDDGGEAAARRELAFLKSLLPAEEVA